ncbi:MAG TPA: sensor histidine kinase [Ktedonobacteraceae bacterium]|nr:sensor histidine kinase [Ktedonobacteraceae bacterium]
MQQKTVESIRTSQVGLTAQLIVSHVLAGGVTLAVAFALVDAGVQWPFSIAIAVLVGGALGWLLTLNIQRALSLLELTLARLVERRPVSSVSAGRYWPLVSLFALMNGIIQSAKEQEERDRRAAEYREQAMRQAGEAAAQEERNRLARDLHDSIKQQLFSISVSAAAARARVAGEASDAEHSEGSLGSSGNGGSNTQAVLDDIQRSAQEAQVEMQALLQQLRPAPLEQMGLVESLRIQAQALGYRTAAEVSVELETLPPDDRLPPGTPEMLFRVVQEAFSNIARHARAQRVQLKLYQKKNALRLDIQDDGQGFDPSSARQGMGLPNINERIKQVGGTMDLSSQPGEGTSLHLRIPLREYVAAATLAEQEWRDAELSRLMRQAREKLTFSANAIAVTGLLLLFNAPILLYALALGAALYSYIQAQFYRSQVRLIAGHNSIQELELRYEEDYNLASIFLFCAIGITYLPVAPTHWPLAITQLVTEILASLFLLLCLVESIRWYVARSRYYRLLTPTELRKRIGKKQRAIISSLTAWFVVVVLTLLIGDVRFPVPFLTSNLNDWWNNVVIVLLVIWPILEGIDYLYTISWKTPARVKEAYHD